MTTYLSYSRHFLLSCLRWHNFAVCLGHLFMKLQNANVCILCFEFYCSNVVPMVILSHSCQKNEVEPQCKLRSILACFVFVSRKMFSSLFVASFSPDCLHSGVKCSVTPRQLIIARLPAKLALLHWLFFDRSTST